MSDGLGFSAYLTTFSAQWPTLSRWAGSGAPIFLSLHMAEEAGLCEKAEQICHLLADHGFRIIADVSRKTLELFGEPDLIRLAIRLRLYALRIDYGFSGEEMGDMAEKIPIVLNASTISREDALAVGKRGQEVFGLHNFYPRPETGLDREYLLESTRMLHETGLKVLAFIPGDETLRGPIYEGLPTLEDHRGVIPSAAFVDLTVNFGIDDIFVGDPGISQKEQDRIGRFCRDHVISVPAYLREGYDYLYDQVFTCRVDSPRRMVRFEESRTYACAGRIIEPENCVERQAGCITMDNRRYARYSGEIQMIRQTLPPDERVNVIGSVPENARVLMDCIHGNQKFMLVRP